MVASAAPTLVRSENRGRGRRATARAAESSILSSSRMAEPEGHLVGGDARLRVMVVFEDDYRSYREAIARALEILRPHADVTVAGLDALDAEFKRIAPDLVICSQPNAGDARGALVWVEIPCDPTRPTAVCLEGRCSETTHLTLNEMVSIVDAAEALCRARAIIGDGPLWRP
jgi:hypothetical protein